MIFFSGFLLQNESELFDRYLENREFVVAGFSYGAIKAFEYVLKTNKRVDKLQLFSPAFFQNRDEKFKRLQLISYQKDKISYQNSFYKNIAYPSKKDLTKYKKDSHVEDLKELLYYEWKKESLKRLQEKGIEIEIFLAQNDKIINSLELMEFFKEFGNVYFIKKVGHILW